MQNVYNAPVEEIKFLLNNVLDIKSVLEIASPDITVDVVNAVIDEAARFAKAELLPLNEVGDKEGCKLNNGEVTTPKGFKEAYKKFAESGWNSIPFPAENGGQGLPWSVAIAVSEIWNGANMAFALCPLLTQGAVEALLHHASNEQKEKYLANLISGKWTGTMCLTEPQAGSDLAAIKTRAVKSGEHYLIKGQKIFITYGEHDYTDNIIHMVLARVEGAPEGVKGISLFIVPKILDGDKRNDLKAISIEHKMGIHASPTAVMQFGENEGAVGYLVGEEHQGLKYMFTMMNNARLSVGVEGLGISESSYQQAYAYAIERVQGKAIAKNEEEKTTGTIIDHADVYRMLMTIRAKTESSRAIIYYVARSMDMARYHKDEKVRQKHQDIVDLLTPVAKAFATDSGFENASTAMQVFGGIGYIEETGIAQNLRDSRIAMIYEGTNGIQSMDLVMRKLNLHDGRLVDSLKEEISGEPGIVSSLYAEGVGATENGTEDTLFTATAKMQKLAKEEPYKAAMLASHYLKLFALCVGSILLNDACKVLQDSKEFSEEFIKNKTATAEFYNNYILLEVSYLEKLIEG